MPIDLKTQPASGLRNLLVNSKRLGNAEMEMAVVQEMHERGIATGKQYAIFSWNQEHVDEVMQPFASIASGVPNNQRVSYTRAGGRKIGLSKNSPGHIWIDSYSAIEVSGINAVFGCEIKRPGEDPKFTLYLGDGSRHEASPSKIYEVEQLAPIPRMSSRFCEHLVQFRYKIQHLVRDRPRRAWRTRRMSRRAPR
jgi:hypothetical protein